MTTPNNGHRPNLLTDEQEVTLRRVAFGQSEAKSMRAHDLAQLRRLALIEDGKEGPQLTGAGRTIFDGRPKAIGQQEPARTDDLLRHVERLLRDAAALGWAKRLHGAFVCQRRESVAPRGRMSSAIDRRRQNIWPRPRLTKGHAQAHIAQAHIGSGVV